MEKNVTRLARPGFIGAGASAVFAWYHAARAETRRRAGIVLCAPLGYEYRSAYRTWRMLAEQLAGRGFDVLRFDYEGTGNSADGVNDDAATRLERWMQDVHRAIDELRVLAEPHAVALAGLRMGAVLALQVASTRDDVERLALWEAFTSGRAYVRELRALARLSQQDHAADDADPASINAAGYVLPQPMLDALARWTVADVKTAPARDVLLVDRSDRPVDPALADHLTGLGIRVTTGQHEGTGDMLAPPHRAKVPESIMTAIVEWFDSWRPVQRSSAAARSDSGRGLEDAHATRDYSERPVRFGPDQRLFGMLVRPELDTALPAIVLLTTGVEHHVGPHRLYVPLAREWAASGHTVLRYDVGGVGDSLPPPGGAENTSYPPHLVDDMAAAIGFVRRLAADRPVVVVGLCSGGWAAYRAAAEDLAVDGFVSVNPPLYLRDRDAGASWRSEIDELEKYQQLRWDPAQWTKALRRPRNLGNAARLATRVWRRRTSALGDRTRSAGRHELAADLDRIARRGVKALFVFSGSDKGLEYFQTFGTAAFRLPHVQEQMRYAVVDGAGHSFRPVRAQERLRELLIEFVKAQTAQTS